MISRISIIVLIIVCLFSGVGYCDYYTSKTNPSARISYVAMSSGVSVSESSQYSKQNPDYIYYIPAAFFFQQGHFYCRGEIVDDRMDEFANQIYAREMARKAEEKKSNVIGTIYTYMFLAFVIIALIVGSGIVTSCPKCKKWWERDFEYREEINRRHGYKTVTDSMVHRDPNGRQVGRTDYNREVPATYVTYLNYYRCAHCGYKWRTASEHEN